jgi:protein required for attachment to host cells
MYVVMKMYNNLIAELARKHISKKQISELLEFSAGTMRNKLSRNMSDFTIKEIQTIYNTYFKDDEKVTLLELMEFDE